MAPRCLWHQTDFTNVSDCIFGEISLENKTLDTYSPNSHLKNQFHQSTFVTNKNISVCMGNDKSGHVGVSDVGKNPIFSFPYNTCSTFHGREYLIFGKFFFVERFLVLEIKEVVEAALSPTSIQPVVGAQVRLRSRH